MTDIGTMTAVEYQADRDGFLRTYRHDFTPSAAPELAYDGDDLVSSGGDFSVDDAGWIHDNPLPPEVLIVANRKQKGQFRKGGGRIGDPRPGKKRSNPKKRGGGKKGGSFARKAATYKPRDILLMSAGAAGGAVLGLQVERMTALPAVVRNNAPLVTGILGAWVATKGAKSKRGRMLGAGLAAGSLGVFLFGLIGRFLNLQGQAAMAPALGQPLSMADRVGIMLGTKGGFRTPRTGDLAPGVVYDPGVVPHLADLAPMQGPSLHFGDLTAVGGDLQGGDFRLVNDW